MNISVQWIVILQDFLTVYTTTDNIYGVPTCWQRQSRRVGHEACASRARETWTQPVWARLARGELATIFLQLPWIVPTLGKWKYVRHCFTFNSPEINCWKLIKYAFFQYKSWKKQIKNWVYYLLKIYIEIIINYCRLRYSAVRNRKSNRCWYCSISKSFACTYILVKIIGCK